VNSRTVVPAEDRSQPTRPGHRSAAPAEDTLGKRRRPTDDEVSHSPTVLSTSPHCDIFISSSFHSQTVLPNAALVRKAAKTAADGLPTRRKTTNVRGTQIDGVEIAKKTPATAVRHHQKRCDNLVFFCCRTPLSRATLRETQKKKSERKRNKR
jgi:hypothetical protein